MAWQWRVSFPARHRFHENVIHQTYALMHTNPTAFTPIVDKSHGKIVVNEMHERNLHGKISIQTQSDLMVPEYVSTVEWIHGRYAFVISDVTAPTRDQKRDELPGVTVSVTDTRSKGVSTIFEYDSDGTYVVADRESDEDEGKKFLKREHMSQEQLKDLVHGEVWSMLDTLADCW